MAYAIGRGVRVEIGSTEGTSKTVTAVTNAKPGVATSTAHGLAAKSIGYFSVASGMPLLEGQAVRLNPVTTNDFTLEGLDTTNYGTFTSGTLIPISAWQTLSPATDYNIAGGEADRLDVTTLLDDIKQEMNGQLSAMTVTFTLRTETINGAALAKVDEVARAGGYLVFRITLKDGNVRVFRGQPSIPSEQLATSQVGSGSFTVTVKGFVQQGAA